MDPGSLHGQQTENNVYMFGLKTEAETLKKLQDCLEPLRENQVQVDSFTVSDMFNLGFISHRMVKHVRVLTTIAYKDVRDSVLLKANSLGICPLSHEMNLRHVVDVCSWMKTESGIKDLVEVQRSEKLKRRAAAKGRTLAEASMIRAINAQFAEYSDKMKEVYCRETPEKEIFAIRDKYWPASTFHISNILNEDSILDFCWKEGVKSKLIEYVKGLIEGETKIYPQRKVGVLGAVLAGMVDGNDIQVSCKGENSNLNDKLYVGKKRKDATVLDHVGEPLMSKTRPRKK